eukprot:Skav220680  [mRNA]  locus=scaffold384:236186:242862:+ [translate_table: standard]
MHGRVKKDIVEPTPEEKAKQREQVRQTYNDQALEMTSKALQFHPEFPTLWGYRRELLTSTEKPLQDLLKMEMKLLEKALRKSQKVYSIWFHRKWVVERLFQELKQEEEAIRNLLTNELDLCNQLLAVDERNFHCWNHRMHLIDLMRAWGKDQPNSMDLNAIDLKLSTDLINQNFSNYSAWHLRTLLQQPLGGEEPRMKLNVSEELEWVQQGIYTEPNDQSVWLYHQWLTLDQGKQPRVTHCALLDGELFVFFSKAVCASRATLTTSEGSQGGRLEPISTSASRTRTRPRRLQRSWALGWRFVPETEPPDVKGRQMLIVLRGYSHDLIRGPVHVVILMIVNDVAGNGPDSQLFPAGTMEHGGVVNQSMSLAHTALGLGHEVVSHFTVCSNNSYSPRIITAFWLQSVGGLWALAMRCLGLAKEWERDGTIRERLRETKQLLVQGVGDSFCKANRPNCTSNAAVLTPVLLRIREDTTKRRLPHMESLKLEVATIYQKSGITSMGEKGIYKNTMEIKQLAGFVKRRAARKEDPEFHKLILAYDPDMKDKRVFQEVIDNYMSTCKRSNSVSSEALSLDDDVDADDESKSEFDDFKKWLDENASELTSEQAQPAVPKEEPQTCAELQARKEQIRAIIAKKKAELQARAGGQAEPLFLVWRAKRGFSMATDQDETQALEEQHDFNMAMPADDDFPTGSEGVVPVENEALPVLTRRDQLKMKETKEQAKKTKATKKKKEDENEPVDEAEDTVAKKPAAKASRRKRKSEEEQGDPAKDQQEKPQPKRKSRAKAKADPKQAAKKSEEKDGKSEEKDEEKDGKSQGPAKAKAPRKTPKRKAKAAAKQKAKKDSEEEDEETDLSSCRRKLFQEEEEEEGNEKHERLVSRKTGEVKPLRDIFEDDKVNEWKKSRASSVKEPTASSSAEPGAKGRGRGAKKQALSPFAKKEAKRRKKAVEDTMHEQLEEDMQMQGILLQHLKQVDDLPFDEAKAYLLSKAPKETKKFVLDPYWSRTACGVKSKEMAEGKTLPQAQWMDDLNKEDIEDYADPTSRVKRHESFIKFNASMVATKHQPSKK